MKRYALQIATAVILAVALVVSWPSIHTNLIRARIKSAIRGSSAPPKASTIDRAITEFDPPSRVLDALWEVATSPASTRDEMEHAGLVLAMLSESAWSLETGHRYSKTDWDEAFTRLLERERKRGMTRSAALDQWLDYLDRNWRASSSGKPIPP